MNPILFLNIAKQALDHSARVFLAVVFLLSVLLPYAAADTRPDTTLIRKAVFPQRALSASPLSLKGVKVAADNPFEIEFLVNDAGRNFRQDDVRDEALFLIRYFLASLTIPEHDLWVNLSPYEKERIIPEDFGLTEMGRDLLWQDYVLKQKTAALLSPSHPVGETYWQALFDRLGQEYSIEDFPIESFSKVWIVPDEAHVFVTANSAFVKSSRLKVLVEADYLANVMHQKENNPQQDADAALTDRQAQSLAVFKKIVLPQLEQAVNDDPLFTELRQIYEALILSTWYKRHMRATLLGTSFVDQKKISGVDVADLEVKQKIYDQYVTDLRRGVYNQIMENYDPVQQKVVPVKFFTGGLLFTANQFGQALEGAYREFAVQERPDILTTDDAMLNALSVQLLPNYNPVSNIAADRAVQATEEQSYQDINSTTDSAMITKTDITAELGSLQHDETLVPNYPLKLAIVDILKKAGIPIKDGLIIDTRAVADTENPAELRARLLSYVKDAFGDRQGPFILRSLDDDIGAVAGMLESFVIENLSKDFPNAWRTLNDNYERNKDLLTRDNLASYAGYLSSSQLLRVMQGESIELKDYDHMGLLQPLHQTSHSGVITTSRDRIIVNFKEGLYGSVQMDKAKRLVISYDGDLIFDDIDHLVPEANRKIIAKVVRDIRTALYNQFNISGREWIIEFGADLYEGELNFGVFQVRTGPNIVMTAEEEVNPLITPEIFRFGRKGLPVSGNPVIVRTQAELEQVKQSDIVLVRNADILVNNLVFSKMPEIPQAILTDGGSRSQHTILNIRFQDVFSARPKFFEELLAQAADKNVIEIALDRKKGSLQYKTLGQQGEAIPYAVTRQSQREANAQLLAFDEIQFQAYAATAWEQARTRGYVVHPQRSEEELVVNGDDRFFQTSINGVKLILPYRKEYLVMSNEMLVQSLKGPLRLAFSIYNDVVLAFPYYQVTPEGKSHTGMNWLYNRNRAPGEEEKSQLQSIRAWNFRGGQNENEAFEVETAKGIDLENTFGGDEGVRPKTDAEELIGYLNTLRKIGMLSRDLEIRFQMNQEERYQLALTMLKVNEKVQSGDIIGDPFENDYIFQVLSYKAFSWQGTTYLVPYGEYNAALRESYRRSDDVWKRILTQYAQYAISDDLNPVVELRPGVKLLTRSQQSAVRQIDDQVLDLLLDIQAGEQNTTDAGMLTESDTAVNVTGQAEQNVGGINLDPKLLKIFMETDSGSAAEVVPSPSAPTNIFNQPIQLDNVQGFTPVIFSITPITNLPLFLGYSYDNKPLARNESNRSFLNQNP